MKKLLIGSFLIMCVASLGACVPPHYGYPPHQPPVEEVKPKPKPPLVKPKPTTPVVQPEPTPPIVRPKPRPTYPTRTETAPSIVRPTYPTRTSQDL